MKLNIFSTAVAGAMLFAIPLVSHATTVIVTPGSLLPQSTEYVPTPTIEQIQAAVDLADSPGGILYGLTAGQIANELNDPDVDQLLDIPDESYVAGEAGYEIVVYPLS